MDLVKIRARAALQLKEFWRLAAVIFETLVPWFIMEKVAPYLFASLVSSRVDHFPLWLQG
jgi:hypothetical protein